MASFLNGTARQIWDPDNTIGTDTILPQQSVGMPRPSEDARTVGGGLWGQPRPISADAVRKFGEGAKELYEQAMMAAMGGEMPRGSSAMPPRVREPVGNELAMRRFESVSSNEQLPGDVTGLNAGPMSKRDFSNASSWRDEVTGKDRLIEDVMGTSGEAVPVVGAYRNARGVMEHNDALASPARFNRFPADPNELDPRLAKTLSGVEATRSVIDLQEGQGRHFVDPTAPSASANSLKITGPGGRVPTEAEMAKLADLGDKYKMTAVANSPDGVVFINDVPPGEVGFRSGGAIAQELRQGLQKDIQTAFPGSSVVRGKYHGDYLYQGDKIGYADQGQGTAVKALADRLEEMKALAPQEYMRLIRSPAVQEKAQQNIERIILSGQLNARPDYVRMLNLVSGGRLEALLKHMLNQGPGGLP